LGNVAALSAPEGFSDGPRSLRRSHKPDLRENVRVNAVNRRIRNKWSEGTLSTKSGIRTERLHRILQGNVSPTVNETQQLADAFACTVKELQTKED
jgi:ribosome-binding protein aMBF1 (putative translation factor)